MNFEIEKISSSLIIVLNGHIEASNEKVIDVFSEKNNYQENGAIDQFVARLFIATI